MYYPIWQTLKYGLEADSVTYRIVYGDATIIYQGRAVRMPGEQNVIIYLNGICKDYLNSLIYENLGSVNILDDVVLSSLTSGSFHIDIYDEANDTWTTDYSWGFVNDWSYEKDRDEIDSGTLSDPINGHASTDMLIPYTYFQDSGTTQICYDIRPNVIWDLQLNPVSLTAETRWSFYNLEVKSNLPWHAEWENTDAYLINMSSTYGGSGTTNVTVSFADNEISGNTPGHATITFLATDKTGEVEKSITWYQDKVYIEPHWENSAHTINIPYNQTAITMYIDSNYKWIVHYPVGVTGYTVSGTGSRPVDIDLPVNTNTANTQTFTIDIYSQPQHTITAATMTVIQAVKPSVDISFTASGGTSAITIGSGATSVAMDVESNTSWGINASGFTGYSISPTSGTGNTTVYLSVAASDVPVQRRLYITATTTNNDASDTAILIQKAAVPYEIKYTTVSGNITNPNTSEGWGANIVSNTYSGGVGTIRFDSPVTDIPDNAFSGNADIRSIEMPDSVTSIGYSGFYDCSSLTGVTLSNNLISIGGTYCFSKCTSLEGITIPNSVTSIGDTCFRDCSSLTGVTLSNNLTSIGSGCFSNCSSLTGITIPNSVTSIGRLCFYECSALTEVTLSSNLTSIGESCFGYCISLTGITIPSGVTSIGRSCFYDCSALTEVTLSSNLTSIGDSCFRNCTSLEGITIPSGVTSIEQTCFMGCTSLTGITAPNVDSIGEDAFENCTGLVNAQFNSSTPLTVDRFSFRGCRSLTSITPNTISIAVNDTYYGEGAFAHCSALTGSIIITGTTQLGEDFFYNCKSLTSITIGANINYIGDVFDGCSSVTRLYAYPTTAPSSSAAPSILLLELGNNGFFHYPSGGSRLSYSDWITKLESKGWTAIGDL